MTLQQLHCVEYMNIISRLSIGLRRPALSHVHCISLYSMLICICCKYFLALGSSIAMRIAYHFGRWRCKNWFTEMCCHNSSVTSLLFTLFMIFLLECLQAPCPHPLIKSCPRVFSPGPLHPDSLYIYPGTTTDDSTVCCPVRHEPPVVHQVCLYIRVQYMYWVFIIFHWALIFGDCCRADK